MPVPGTTTPEPEPVEVESAAALPSPSIAETCVVPPGAASSRGRVEAFLDPALRRAKRCGRKQPAGEPAAVEPAA